jgi:DegV family protein with EDD domain
MRMGALPNEYGGAMDNSPMPAAAVEPQFDVVSDHGFDAFPTLANRPIVTPFVVQVGSVSYHSTDMPLQKVLAHLEDGGPHPTTSQPAPEVYAETFRQAQRPVLAITVSGALSGSLNAANQARALVPELPLTLHDSGTVCAGQSFQVHAAMTARARGLSLDTAIEWMRAVHAETEFLFTIDTLTYLQRGGRIGRVQATLGTMLDLKPIIAVDKSVGAYVTAARARGWKKALVAIAERVTGHFGEGTPLRIGLVHGLTTEAAETVLGYLRTRHPIHWSDLTPTGAALAVHVGPISLALGVAPGVWPWEREGA